MTKIMLRRNCLCFVQRL